MSFTNVSFTYQSVLNTVKRSAIVVLVAGFTCSFAMAQGNPQAGQGKVAVCVACHGESGNESVLPNVPKLGGQGEKYLLKQLQEIKSDVRPVPLMAGLLNNMSDQDLADISAYYASLEAPKGAVHPDQRVLGEKIYRAGIATIGVPACTACHAPNGQGNGPAGYPALGGQDVAYTELQLKAFRAGDRDNDGLEVMRTIAARMSDAEIAAIASFVSGLR